jgi:Kef-type K+ transport system membrane component KefB
MVPRGEVGLIFAGTGLAAGVVAPDLYSALVVVVMLTTFVAPPWLKALYRGG